MKFLRVLGEGSYFPCSANQNINTNVDILRQNFSGYMKKSYCTLHEEKVHSFIVNCMKKKLFGRFTLHTTEQKFPLLTT